jgi:SpoVK/Ycf46/Vps4 family AAA+-type ATPase
MNDIADAKKNAHRESVAVHLYRHRWRLVCRKHKRPLGSVVLDAGVASELVRDVGNYLEGRQWYREHSVPYRRGYMLEGPPGCGKTSLVLALASLFEKPVYALNIGSIAYDESLIEAVSEVPENGILLIEDIDAVNASAKRLDKPPEVVAPQGTKLEHEEAAREVSLSALLNVLDGAFSSEGRILFMTTNHPEKVDPALVRAGRVDQRISLGPLRGANVVEMCSLFLPKQAAEEFAARYTEVTAAELQEDLVRYVRFEQASFE